MHNAFVEDGGDGRPARSIRGGPSSETASVGLPAARRNGLRTFTIDFLAPLVRGQCGDVGEVLCPTRGLLHSYEIVEAGNADHRTS